jgi:hypothetical protein
MPRETIKIPVSSGPLFEAVAVFISVLAYPNDKTRRECLRKAWCREAVRSEAAWDSEFARTEYGRPEYMLMNEEPLVTRCAMARKSLAFGRPRRSSPAGYSMERRWGARYALLKRPFAIRSEGEQYLRTHGSVTKTQEQRTW